jgi:hypothetical protein
MIQEHLDQLRTALQQAPSLPETTRSELLALVAAIEKEAAGRAGAAEVAGVEGADEQSGLGKLAASVEELEASHPELAASINQVAITLSKMGI